MDNKNNIGQGADDQLFPLMEPAAADDGCGGAERQPAAICCGSAEPFGHIDTMGQAFVLGRKDTPAGPVPRVAADLSSCDHWGGVKARWGVGRMDYRIAPGLYALGEPDRNSEVLVSANYKLSFDHLRRELPGRSAWILVLDTNGINVWCAAGHGSFGTTELVTRIREAGLDMVVDHRRVIVPQLGAPGVAAHLVKRASGFKVVWGPIQARDLPLFLDAGLKADPAMRNKAFPLHERLVLVPVELTHAAKWLAMILPAVIILGGLGGLVSPGEPVGFLTGVATLGLTAALAVIGGFVAGAIITPLALPWLPGRAFAMKGLWAGLAVALVIIVWRTSATPGWAGNLESAAWLLIITALSAFLGMNFTGSSTYTGLSGVKKEMAVAVPLEITAASLGILAWLGALYLA